MTYFAPPELLTLLQGLTNGQNNIREEHEKLFEKEWVSRPSVLLPSLCQVIQTNNDAVVRP
jgi:hypothetical protein